jgi:phthiodiolone/phenolphthiodiolone dimycocerosates ketoreductase
MVERPRDGLLPEIRVAMLLAGTPDEVLERAAEWRDCGVRYVVLANMGVMQQNLRKGMASVMSFTQVVRRLKKL